MSAAEVDSLHERYVAWRRFCDAVIPLAAQDDGAEGAGAVPTQLAGAARNAPFGPPVPGRERLRLHTSSDPTVSSAALLVTAPGGSYGERDRSRLRAELRGLQAALDAASAVDRDLVGPNPRSDEWMRADLDLSSSEDETAEAEKEKEAASAAARCQSTASSAPAVTHRVVLKKGRKTLGVDIAPTLIALPDGSVQLLNHVVHLRKRAYAATQGVIVGDVIVSVNGTPLFQGELSAAHVEKAIQLSSFPKTVSFHRPALVDGASGGARGAASDSAVASDAPTNFAKDFPRTWRRRRLASAHGRSVRFPLAALLRCGGGRIALAVSTLNVGDDTIAGTRARVGAERDADADTDADAGASTVLLSDASRRGVAFNASLTASALVRRCARRLNVIPAAAVAARVVAEGNDGAAEEPALRAWFPGVVLLTHADAGRSRSFAESVFFGGMGVLPRLDRSLRECIPVLVVPADPRRLPHVLHIDLRHWEVQILRALRVEAFEGVACLRNPSFDQWYAYSVETSTLPNSRASALTQLKVCGDAVLVRDACGVWLRKEALRNSIAPLAYENGDGTAPAATASASVVGEVDWSDEPPSDTLDGVAKCGGADVAEVKKESSPRSTSAEDVAASLERMASGAEVRHKMLGFARDWRTGKLISLDELDSMSVQKAAALGGKSTAEKSSAPDPSGVWSCSTVQECYHFVRTGAPASLASDVRHSGHVPVHGAQLDAMLHSRGINLRLMPLVRDHEECPVALRDLIAVQITAKALARVMWDRVARKGCSSPHGSPAMFASFFSTAFDAWTLAPSAESSQLWSTEVRSELLLGPCGRDGNLSLRESEMNCPRLLCADLDWRSVLGPLLRHAGVSMSATAMRRVQTVSVSTVPTFSATDFEDLETASADCSDDDSELWRLQRSLRRLCTPDAERVSADERRARELRYAKLACKVFSHSSAPTPASQVASMQTLSVQRSGTVMVAAAALRCALSHAHASREEVGSVDNALRDAQFVSVAPGYRLTEVAGAIDAMLDAESDDASHWPVEITAARALLHALAAAAVLSENRERSWVPHDMLRQCMQHLSLLGSPLHAQPAVMWIAATLLRDASTIGTTADVQHIFAKGASSFPQWMSCAAPFDAWARKNSFGSVAGLPLPLEWVTRSDHTGAVRYFNANERSERGVNAAGASSDSSPTMFAWGKWLELHSAPNVRDVVWTEMTWLDTTIMSAAATPHASPMRAVDAVVMQVSCGAAHAAVVTNRGRLYTFGRGMHGQLGLGDSISRARPFLVDYFIRCERNVASVSCGGVHTAAITTDGCLFTWGCADDGRLGLGYYEPLLDHDETVAKEVDDDSTTERLVLGSQSIPTRVLDYAGASESLAAGASDTIDGIACDVACGAAHTIVVSAAGNVQAFGAGGVFQLGNRYSDSWWVPTPVELLLRSQGATSSRPSSPIVDFDDDESDSTSSESDEDRPPTSSFIAKNATRRTPLQHANSTGAEEVPLIVAVAAGVAHSVALSALGEVFTWGFAESGALGRSERFLSGDLFAVQADGIDAPRVAIRTTSPRMCCPRRVHGLPCAAQSIAVGAFSTFVTLGGERAGEVWTFGANDEGQLGVATRPSELESLREAASAFDEVLGDSGVAEGWFTRKQLEGGGSATFLLAIPAAVAKYRDYLSLSARRVTPPIITSAAEDDDRRLQLRRQRRGRRRNQRRRISTILSLDDADMIGDSATPLLDAFGDEGTSSTETVQWAWGSYAQRVCDPTQIELPFAVSFVSGSFSSACAVGREGELWRWGACGNEATPAPFPAAEDMFITHTAMCWEHTLGEAHQSCGFVVGRPRSGAADVSTAVPTRSFPAAKSDELWVEAAIMPAGHSRESGERDTHTEVFVFGSYDDVSNDEASMQGGPIVLPQLQGSKIVQVASGRSHSLALSFDGRVFEWGAEALANKRHRRITPRVIEPLCDARAVACGDNHCVVLLNSGRLCTWNIDDPIDSKFLVDSSVSPSRSGDAVSVVEVVAGGAWTLAVTKDSRLLWSKERDAPPSRLSSETQHGEKFFSPLNELTHRDTLPTKLHDTNEISRARTQARQKARKETSFTSAKAKELEVTDLKEVEKQLVHSAVAAARARSASARKDPLATRKRLGLDREHRRQRKQKKSMEKAMKAAMKTERSQKRDRRSLAKLSKATQGNFETSCEATSGGAAELAPIVNQSASGKGVSIRFSDAQLTAISGEPAAVVAAATPQITAISQRRSSSGGMSFSFDLIEEKTSPPRSRGESVGEIDDAMHSSPALLVHIDDAPTCRPSLPRPESNSSLVVGFRAHSSSKANALTAFCMGVVNEVGSAIESSRGEELHHRDSAGSLAFPPPVASASEFGWFARSAVGDLYTVRSREQNELVERESESPVRAAEDGHDGRGSPPPRSRVVSADDDLKSLAPPPADEVDAIKVNFDSIISVPLLREVQNGRPLLSRDVAISRRLLSGVTVRSVACGREHALILTNVGEVWCWGQNSDGQLGFGDTVRRATAQLLPRPWAVSTTLHVETPLQVICGAKHSVVITKSGVFTAGKRTRGCLGRILTLASPCSVFASIDLLDDLPVRTTARVVDAAAGDAHTVVVLRFTHERA